MELCKYMQVDTKKLIIFLKNVWNISCVHTFFHKWTTLQDNVSATSPFCWGIGMKIGVWMKTVSGGVGWVDVRYYSITKLLAAGVLNGRHLFGQLMGWRAFLHSTGWRLLSYPSVSRGEPWHQLWMRPQASCRLLCCAPSGTLLPSPLHHPRSPQLGQSLESEWKCWNLMQQMCWTLGWQNVTSACKATYP